MVGLKELSSIYFKDWRKEKGSFGPAVPCHKSGELQWGWNSPFLLKKALGQCTLMASPQCALCAGPTPLAPPAKFWLWCSQSAIPATIPSLFSVFCANWVKHRKWEKQYLSEMTHALILRSLCTDTLYFPKQVINQSGKLMWNMQCNKIPFYLAILKVIGYSIYFILPCFCSCRS